MSSGFKEILINPNERAISTDINRLQKFKGADVAELLRYMWDVSSGSDDLDAGGVVTEYSTVGTPLRAEVINGLMIRPAVGSINLSIDPGVLLALFPDAAADDSNYKYVHDAGVASGTLTVATNTSGSTRIDIIECQPTPQNAESATRDIYNPISSAFAPTLVTKATNMKLTYRVRQGVGGSGFPGTVSGWLPLAVVIIPTGNSSNDQCTFYDVRPLIADRAGGMFNFTQSLPRKRVHSLYGDNNTGGTGQLRLSGLVDYEFNGRRVGGKIAPGFPGLDPGYCDLLNTLNQEQGFAAPTNGLAFLYLAFPAGLPRWAKYTDYTTGNRVPRSPRGLILMSTKGPQHATGVPTTGSLTLPTAWGFGAGSSATQNAFFIGAVRYVAGAIQQFGINDGFERAYAALPGGFTSNANAGFALASGNFTLTENTHFPATAKSILVSMVLAVNLAVSSTIVAYPTLQICDANGNPTDAAFNEYTVQFTTTSTPAQTFSIVYTVELPIPTKWPGSTTPGTYKINYLTNLSTGVGTSSLSGTPGLQVVGWRL